MKDDILKRLPDQVRGLLDEIEDFANLPVGIELNTEPISPTDPNPDRSSARISHDRATIHVQSADVPPNSILHELLHVHRYWVGGIPQIMPIGNSDNQWKVTSQIENCLEHQIIVPREADYGFEPYSYWNRTVKILWERYPWPDPIEPSLRRDRCLLGWLSCCRLVTDEKVKSQGTAR